MTVRIHVETLIIPLSHFPGRRLLYSSDFHSVWFYFYYNSYHLSLVVLGSPSKQEQDLGKEGLASSVTVTNS